MTLKSRHHRYQLWIFNTWLYHNKVHTLNEYALAKLYAKYPRRGQRTGPPSGFRCAKFTWFRGRSKACLP